MNKKGENRKFSPCNFSLKNRRGQFYLVAAIIIITIAAGFVTVSNYIQAQQTTDIYDLRDEIRIESSRLTEYARITGANFQTTMADFSEVYIKNSTAENLYFIFGKQGAATFMAYQSFASEVSLDSVDKTGAIGTGSTYTENFAGGSEVVLGIDENNYIFKLGTGDSYGFVISSKKGGQTYIARG